MLLFRAFKLCSNFELFHLKDIFKRNGYPCNFIEICIKRFLSNIFIDKKVYAFASKKELACLLPFIERKSLQLRSKLVQKNLYSCHRKLFSSHHTNFAHCFVLKTPLIKKSVLILFIVICVVAAMLLIMVKLTNTFLQEQQFLITYYNVIAQLILTISIF